MQEKLNDEKTTKDFDSTQIKKSITQYADAVASKKPSGDSDHNKGGVASSGKKDGAKKVKEDGSVGDTTTPEMQQKIQRILASQWDSR